MFRRRTTHMLALALLSALLGMPASAAAATFVAPSLQSPAASGASFNEGGSIRFQWSGTLQGHPAELERSFFRLEVAKAADVPAGSQDAWSNLETFAQTPSGSATTQVTLGVPDAGSYRWRVCAWGVVNPETDNDIQRLDGGCSAARSFSSTAGAAGGGTIKELVVENRTTAPGRVETVVVRRQRTSTETEPEQVAPVAKTPAPRREVAAPVEQTAPPVPAVFTALRATPTSGGDSRSAVAISSDAGGIGDTEAAASRRKASGVRGAIGAGLGSTLPLVPVPFWTLLLLLACIPIARAWRGSVLGMFDWSDGTIDGSGGSRDAEGELVPVLVASEFKLRSNHSDGEARPPVPDAAAGRRRAA